MESIPIIDLHEDISYYFIGGAGGLKFRLEDFDEDLPGRHGDIPKYRRANVKIIMSSVFCLLSTIAPRVKKLEKGYGFKIRAWTPKASPLTALQHIKVYYELVKMHSKDLMLILTEKDVHEALTGDKIGLLLSMEGTYMLEDVYDLELYYNPVSYTHLTLPTKA